MPYLSNAVVLAKSPHYFSCPCSTETVGIALKTYWLAIPKAFRDVPRVFLLVVNRRNHKNFHYDSFQRGVCWSYNPGGTVCAFAPISRAKSPFNAKTR